MDTQHIESPPEPFIFRGRTKTRDGFMTFDGNPYAVDQNFNAMGRKLGGTFRTADGRTVDSTGAFLVGELERLDQTLHEPLAAVTWGRDIDLREDVTIADEVSSFTLSQYGSPGSLGGGSGIGTGKAWIGKTTDQIVGLSLDIAKLVGPLRPWGMELKYTILELESAAKLGRPIDQQKYAGMQLKHQMDIDEQVYIGDTTTSDTGLLNAASGTVANVTNVATVNSKVKWADKIPDSGSGPDAVLADVNEILTSCWAASAWAVIPSRLLIAPAEFGLISTAKVSTAGNVSVLKYIQENNILTTSGRGRLDIFPCKWCVGLASGGTVGTADGHNRMVAYTKEKVRVRYPMTLLQRTPVQYDSIYHKTTYFCRLGVVEIVYPETLAYRDGTG